MQRSPNLRLRNITGKGGWKILRTIRPEICYEIMSPWNNKETILEIPQNMADYMRLKNANTSR